MADTENGKRDDVGIQVEKVIPKAKVADAELSIQTVRDNSRPITFGDRWRMALGVKEGLTDGAKEQIKLMENEAQEIRDATKRGLLKGFEGAMSAFAAAENLGDRAFEAVAKINPLSTEESRRQAREMTSTPFTDIRKKIRDKVKATPEPEGVQGKVVEFASQLPGVMTEFSLSGGLGKGVRGAITTAAGIKTVAKEGAKKSPGLLKRSFTMAEEFAIADALRHTADNHSVEEIAKSAAVSGGLGLAFPVVGQSAFKLASYLGEKSAIGYLMALGVKPKVAARYVRGKIEKFKLYGFAKDPKDLQRQQEQQMFEFERAQKIEKENYVRDLTRSANQFEERELLRRQKIVDGQKREINSLRTDQNFNVEQARLQNVDRVSELRATTKAEADTVLESGVSALQHQEKQAGDQVGAVLEQMWRREPGISVKWNSVRSAFNKALKQHRMRLRGDKVIPDTPGVAEYEALARELTQTWQGMSRFQADGLIPVRNLYGYKQGFTDIGSSGTGFQKSLKERVYSNLGFKLNPVNLSSRAIETGEATGKDAMNQFVFKDPSVKPLLSDLAEANFGFHTASNQVQRALKYVGSKGLRAGEIVTNPQQVYNAVKTGNPKVINQLAELDKSLPKELQILPSLRKTAKRELEMIRGYNENLSTLKKTADSKITDLQRQKEQALQNYDRMAKRNGENFAEAQTVAKQNQIRVKETEYHNYKRQLDAVKEENDAILSLTSLLPIGSEKAFTRQAAVRGAGLVSVAGAATAVNPVLGGAVLVGQSPKVARRIIDLARGMRGITAKTARSPITKGIIGKQIIERGGRSR